MSWRDADKTPVLGRIFSEHLEKRLGPTRPADAPVEQKHRDLAATLQARLEEVLFENLNALHARTKQKSLCLAGGVAFNCVANGKIFERTPFERVFVQPAAGDAGLAIGAAYYVHHQVLGPPARFRDEALLLGPRLFPSANSRGDRAEPTWPAAAWKSRNLPEEEIARAAAQRIADGNILGWFGGRAEWGPRALGNRSIVADPRRAEMKDILNRRIKHREMFRPFAPSILAECTGEFFETVASVAIHDFCLCGASREARLACRAHARGRHRRACKPSIARPIHAIGG